jgi:hypothetical protein
MYICGEQKNGTMKKILLFLILFAFVRLTMAQHIYYCEIKGIEKDLSVGLKIVFDLGESPVYGVWSSLNGKQKLVDEKGEEIKFNSMVSAGNYLSGKGWKFLQAYSSVYGGNCIVHWVFCKETDSIENAMEGLETVETYKRKHR